MEEMSPPEQDEESGEVIEPLIPRADLEGIRAEGSGREVVLQVPCLVSLLDLGYGATMMQDAGRFCGGCQLGTERHAEGVDPIDAKS